MEKTFQRIPFLRLVISLATGIILATEIKISTWTTFALLLTAFILMMVVNRIYSYRNASIFGISVAFFFIGIGILFYNQYNRKPFLFKDSSFQATVLEIPQEKTASFKSVLNIHHVLKNDSIFTTSEKVLVYFEKDDKTTTLQPGDNIVFSGSPSSIKNRGNPYEFDYKSYMERKKIYRQLYLSSDRWEPTNTVHTFSLVILSEQIREKLLNIYRSQNLGEAQFKILSALTLGYKRELDPEIKSAFSSSGAMHVLAVSGLHVGIIYGVLFFVLGFLRKQKHGRLVFVLITIFSLWSYAFITGLSPSVERAATMFSILVIGENLKRRINIYNSLAASALILLLINPNNLFEAGFQLSYTAVFGIVFLHPKIAELIQVKTKAARFLWTLFTVSVAAQLATFPITLYYFNQFPTYFWLANILVIPAVSILIPLGLSLLIFSKIPLLSTALSFITNMIIKGIYLLLREIEQLPFAVLHESISPIQLIFINSLLICFLCLLNHKKAIYIQMALVSVVLLITSAIFTKTIKQNTRELIVYNYADNTILQLINGEENYVISKDTIKEENYARNLINATTKKLHLKEPNYQTINDSLINNSIFLKDGAIFFADKSIFFNPENKNIPDQILFNFIINPKLSNQTNLSSIKNSIVIVNQSYIPKNLTSAVPLYNVNKEGAFQTKW